MNRTEERTAKRRERNVKIETNKISPFHLFPIWFSHACRRERIWKCEGGQDKAKGGEGRGGREPIVEDKREERRKEKG